MTVDVARFDSLAPTGPAVWIGAPPLALLASRSAAGIVMVRSLHLSSSAHIAATSVPDREFAVCYPRNRRHRGRRSCDELHH
jgi:hypothetical protein